MPDQLTSIPPVRKSVTVPASPERAFELYTAGINDWWPLARYSVGQEHATRVTFGEGLGGVINETLDDGTTAEWGTISEWSPPHRVAFSWYPDGPREQASDVAVTFTSDGRGGTVVELVHTGWERRADGLETRNGYDSGWDGVVAAYASAAGAR